MVEKKKNIGAFLSHLVGKLLGDGRPRAGEIDHNIVVCCGTLTVAEREKCAEEERTGEETEEDGN